jgi:hypothetical protein
MWSRLCSAKARLIGAGFAFALVSMAGVAPPSMAQEGFSADLGIIRACAGDVWRLCSDVLPDVGRIKSCVQDNMGQLSKSCLDKLLDVMARSSFKVCKDQTYALCAAARCNVFDGVAYCQCDVKHGDSISLPFPMGKDEDVCSINAAGAANKYMVSTYSLPESIASPQGGGAAYTCQGEEGGAYAQCDGGLCFRSTEKTTFPFPYARGPAGSTSTVRLSIVRKTSGAVRRGCMPLLLQSTRLFLTPCFCSTRC